MTTREAQALQRQQDGTLWQTATVYSGDAYETAAPATVR